MAGVMGNPAAVETGGVTAGSGQGDFYALNPSASQTGTLTSGLIQKWTTDGTTEIFHAKNAASTAEFGIYGSIFDYTTINAPTNNYVITWDSTSSSFKAKANTGATLIGITKGTPTALTSLGTGALGITTVGGSTSATGTQSTAVGFNSLNALTTGARNVGTGAYTLYLTTTGADNTGIGDSALHQNITGSTLTAVGSSALYAATAGPNDALGYQALTANTTGTFNAGFAYQALTANTTGGSNAAFGPFALGSNTTGSTNCAFGQNTLAANVSSGNNSGFGYQALHVSTSSDNTAVGNAALSGLTSGGNSTAVGSLAGASVTTNGGGVFIGYHAGQLETAANKLYVSNSNSATPLIKGTFGGNVAAALQFGDETNAWFTWDSRTGNSGSSAFTFIPGTAPSFASAAGSSYNSVSLSAYTLTLTGGVAVTALNGLQGNILAPTVTSATATTVTDASTLFIGGPPIAAGVGPVSFTRAAALAIGGATSGLIGINAAAATTNYLCVLPAAIGTANQVLQIASVSGTTATLGWTTVTASNWSNVSTTQVKLSPAASIGVEVAPTTAFTSGSIFSITAPVATVSATLYGYKADLSGYTSGGLSGKRTIGFYFDSPGSTQSFTDPGGDVGVYVNKASSGIYVNLAGSYGVQVNTASTYGFIINSLAAGGVGYATQTASATNINGLIGFLFSPGTGTPAALSYCAQFDNFQLTAAAGKSVIGLYYRPPNSGTFTARTDPGKDAALVVANANANNTSTWGMIWQNGTNLALVGWVATSGAAMEWLDTGNTNAIAMALNVSTAQIAPATGYRLSVQGIAGVANNATGWALSDQTNNYYVLNTQTGAASAVAHTWSVGTAVTQTFAAGNTYSLGSLSAYTLTETITAPNTVTALNGLMLNFAQPTVTNSGNFALTVTTASSLFIGGPLTANGGTGSTTITNALALDLPTFVANGTTAANIRAAAPTGATNNFAFFASSGACGFAGAVGVGFSTVPTGSGINIGASATANSIWNASQGAASTTLWVGNASINVTSDIRLKQVLGPTSRSATEIFRSLQVVDFRWNDPSDTAPVNRNSRGVWTGITAQQAIQYVPWLVNAEDRNCSTCLSGLTCGKHSSTWNTDFGHDFGIIVKGFQEVYKRFETLEDRVTLLEKENAELKARLGLPHGS